MTCVEVQTPSRAYQVKVGAGLLTQTGGELQALGKHGAVFLVSDSRVAPHYAETVVKSCETAGFAVYSYIFPTGEASKNAKTLLALLGAMADCHLTRTDTVLALGGGVTGDMAGLAAALYMRGVGLVQLPTSLLAAVDSSVGGKTAIDLPQGKNLVGTFYQPELVLCDLDTLGTLPPEELANGCAEIVKYAFLQDEAILEQVMRGEDWESLIARCIGIKRDVVAQDERDTGLRQLLNFGHTFAHAIEQASGFQVPHGAAVAIGMDIMTRAAVKIGACDLTCLTRLEQALTACHLPKQTAFSADRLFAIVLNDKKRSADTITVVLPKRIGECRLQKMPVAEVKHLLQLGLEER